MSEFIKLKEDLISSIKSIEGRLEASCHEFDVPIWSNAKTALERALDHVNDWEVQAHSMKQHLPFTAPKKYLDLYDPEELTLSSNPYPPKGVTPFTMSAYGELRKYYKMPKGKEPVNDKLAKSSTVFQNAHCQAPICGPSRASLMTGLRPSTTGIYGQINDKDLRKDNTTMQEAVYLSEYFQKHGYKTMGVGKLFHKSDGAGAFEEYGGIFEKFGPKPTKEDALRCCLV